jgi:pre-mRNA-processing factor 39
MRALDAAGLDFRSDKLWTQYIDWEISIGDYLRASQVYDILLGTPTMGYLSHFERYRQFIESYEPDKILSDQEYESISDRVYEKVKHDLDGQPMFFTEEYEEEIPENEMQEDGRTKRLISRRRHAEVALIEFRSEILLRRTKLHHANELAVNARLKFENGVSFLLLKQSNKRF